MLEPVFPPNGTRIPILQVGSNLHQFFRETKLKGSGISAGWPKWDKTDNCWNIQFGISKEHDEIGQVITLFRLWPDGSGELRLLDRLGERVAAWSVPADDSDEMLDRVWAAVGNLLSEAGDKLIDHMAEHADRAKLRDLVL